MNSINSSFQKSQLAEAAYADFINPSTGGIFITDAGTEGALTSATFSASQAGEFVSQWRVVDQYTAPVVVGVIGTGFSATLFQNLETGRYTFAIRGTNDFVADLLGADIGD